GDGCSGRTRRRGGGCASTGADPRTARRDGDGGPAARPSGRHRLCDRRLRPVGTVARPPPRRRRSMSLADAGVLFVEHRDRGALAAIDPRLRLAAALGFLLALSLLRSPSALAAALALAI